MSEGYELTVGSEYKIFMDGDESDFSGVFEGYTMIGTESAVVIRQNTTKISFIPVSKILYIDLLKSVKEPEHKPQPEHLYG